MCWWVMSEKGTRSECNLGEIFGDTCQHIHSQECMDMTWYLLNHQCTLNTRLLYGASTQRGNLIPFSLLSQYNLSPLNAVLLEPPYRHNPSSTWAWVAWMVRKGHQTCLPLTSICGGPGPWGSRTLDPGKEAIGCCSDIHTELPSMGFLLRKALQREAHQVGKTSAL